MPTPSSRRRSSSRRPGGCPAPPVPRRPFLLDHTSRDEVSTYAADVLLDGVRYAYGFSVTDHEIVEEWLYSYP
ncbi:hypothetical protein GCM10020254_41700 [Streptomyces goshikiensis]